MKGPSSSSTGRPPQDAPARRRAAERLLEIEGNPVTESDRQLFAAFDRQGLKPEERRARIIAQVRGTAAHAAE